MKRTLTQDAPWSEPFPECEWFDLVEDVTLTPGTSSTLLTLTIPTGWNGRVKWFGQHIYNSGSYSNIRWRIYINNGPDKVYGTVVGQISTLLEPTEVFMFLSSNDIIRLDVENIGAVNITLAGRLKGWYWPEQRNNNDY